jgi:hypothetical protein
VSMGLVAGGWPSAPVPLGSVQGRASAHFDKKGVAWRQLGRRPPTSLTPSSALL